MLYLYEYCLYDRQQRNICDLRNFKKIIIRVYKKYLPDARVFVEAHSFFVVTALPITRGIARPIGMEFCRNDEMKQFGKWINVSRLKKKPFRLFTKHGGVKLSLQLLKNIYYMCEKEANKNAF